MLSIEETGLNASSLAPDGPLIKRPFRAIFTRVEVLTQHGLSATMIEKLPAEKGMDRTLTSVASEALKSAVLFATAPPVFNRNIETQRAPFR